MSVSDLFTRPATIVESQIGAMTGYANTSFTRAIATIDALGHLAAVPERALPTFEMPELLLGAAPTTAPPNPALFGDVTSLTLPDPGTGADLVTGLPVDTDLPTFAPSIAGFAIPPAPAPLDTSGLPVRPATTEVTLPAAPVLTLPGMDDLTAITVPEYTFPELPTFSATAPEFTAATPSSLIAWGEPRYGSESLDTLKARVASMLAGGTGLPPAVEAALFDRARAREDITARKAVQEAFDTFASRGFTMPPGMLAAQVNAAVENNQLQVNALSREIFIKAAEWEIENLKFAVQQGLALETQLIAMFQNAATRAFEAAKIRVESDIALYNAQVSLFNARQNAYQTEATVFKTRLEGALSKLEVFKAQIQAAIAVGTLNEQKVKVYQARLSGVAQQVEIFKARMTGAQVEAEINKTRIDAYRADVQGYAEKLAADKTRFDAYEAQIRGEAAKAGILDAEARAFAATLQAVEARSNVKIKNVQARIEGLQAATARFTAQVQAERERVQAEVAQIQARATAYSADVSRYTAELHNDTARADTAARLVEARLRNHLAYFEIQIKEYDATMTRLIEQVKLLSEGMKASGTAAAQLASGAMAAMHVQASLSGSGSASYSESHTYPHPESISTG